MKEEKAILNFMFNISFQEYDRTQGIILDEPGLCVIRTYSVDEAKLPSTVITSRFVL